MHTHRLCILCEERPARVLPSPIPNGTDATWLEYAADQGMYCPACFEEVDER